MGSASLRCRPAYDSVWTRLYARQHALCGFGGQRGEFAGQSHHVSVASSHSWAKRKAISGTICHAVRTQTQLAWRPQSRSHSCIAPTLLNRAHKLRREHADLAAQLQTNYDAEVAKRAGTLAGPSEALDAWERATVSIRELQRMIAEEKDVELKTLAVEELATTTDALAPLATKLQQSLVPAHPFGHLACLVELRPGAGGDEAALFAGDLLRMYRAFCARQSLPCKLLQLNAVASKGAEEQIQDAVLEIAHPGAYDILRCEAGVHRVQRVPATETKGRTHTSAVSVLVLPLFDESAVDETDINNPESDVYVNPSDVRTDVMRASGAGGQHVNMTDSAVRLTHIPTNTVVAVQESRSQHQNRAKAWTLLRSRLAQAKKDAREEQAAALRTSIVGIGRSGRGDKIRTYNWSQQRVTDHRSGLTINRLDDVLEAGTSLEQIMDSVRTWLQTRDLEVLVAQDQE